MIVDLNQESYEHIFFLTVSTPFRLVVDTFPVGCEAPQDRSTLVKLIVDTGVAPRRRLY